MAKDNATMDDILKQARENSTDITYKDAETKDEEKKKSKAGRPKVSKADKKKARQVFYSDNEFEEIEALAEELGIDAKAFMQMAINQKIKNLKGD